MSTRTSSIRIEYKPISTSDSVTTLSGNQRQTYDVNTGYFHPDRRLDPLTLQVTCSVSDPHNFVNGVINNDLTDIVWKITDTTGKLVTIQSTDKQFKIGTGVDKGKITIYKNIPDLDETTLEFTAKYIDPKTKRVVNFQKTFSIITVTEAVAQNQLQLTTPVGTVQFPFVNDKGLVLQADLIREGKKVPAAYWWKKDGKDLTDTSDKIVVLDTIKNGNVYQVEVADCSIDFNTIVNEKVEADQSIINWRNLYLRENENLCNGFKNWTYNNLKADLKITNNLIVFKSVNDTSNITLSAQNIRRIGKFVISIYVEVISATKIYIDGRATVRKTNYEVYRDNEIYFSLPAGFKDFIILNYETPFELTTNWYIGVIPNKKDEVVILKYPKLNLSDQYSPWSPTKYDMDDFVKEKTDYYASQTTLPPGYRPNPKPTNLFKKEVLLKRSLGSYEVDILYPKVVDPDVTEVQFEAVFTNNRGIIVNSSKWFDVGWWKKADGTYEYTGLKIKVPIAKLQSIIDSGKGVEYTVIEK